MLTAIGNYYLDQQEIQDHLDTLMAVSALSYQALLSDDIQKRPLQKIQKTIEKIHKQVEKYYPPPHFYEDKSDFYLDKFNFQVRTDDGKLLLHSSNAPNMPQNADTDGFSDKDVNSEKWRVFTTHNPNTKIRTIVAEPQDARNELGKRIAKDDIYILLLTFPLSGLLIWIIIGRGLKSLERVAREVSNRQSSHLEPVSISEVPSEIKPLVDELNNLFFRLKEGFERETRFTADAAHELRTPLAAIKTQAQVALNSNDIKEKNIALEKLISSVNRSTHIVQQLLIMNKLVPEAININDLDDVNLVKVARDILAMLVPAAVEKHIEIEFEPDEEVPNFKGNTTAIGILIRNLVDNAIRYCGTDGHVIVRVYQEDNNIVLEVQDNGPGIPEELQARVFERFFRVLGNKTSGSGLGLAIVKQICMLHHGRVMLSTPIGGQGLIVNVFFPK